MLVMLPFQRSLKINISHQDMQNDILEDWQIIFSVFLSRFSLKNKDRENVMLLSMFGYNYLHIWSK